MGIQDAAKGAGRENISLDLMDVGRVYRARAGCFDNRLQMAIMDIGDDKACACLRQMTRHRTAHMPDALDGHREPADA